jgi:orotate phosphoribosyltransferase-like protein
MTREQKQMACRLDAKGLSRKAIARDLNYSMHSIEVALLKRFV